MSTRKQFQKIVVPNSIFIPRGGNAVGGTVIGDYLKDGARVIVVEMPKVEKKSAKKSKKGPVTKAVEDAIGRQIPTKEYSHPEEEAIRG